MRLLYKCGAYGNTRDFSHGMECRVHLRTKNKPGVLSYETALLHVNGCLHAPADNPCAVVLLAFHHIQLPTVVEQGTRHHPPKVIVGTAALFHFQAGTHGIRRFPAILGYLFFMPG